MFHIPRCFAVLYVMASSFVIVDVAGGVARFSIGLFPIFIFTACMVSRMIPFVVLTYIRWRSGDLGRRAHSDCTAFIAKDGTAWQSAEIVLAIGYQ